MAPKKRTASVSAATPAAKRATSSSQAKAANTKDLNVGEARYSCLCTRDPEVADDWAARVLKSAGASEAASAPAAVVSLDCEWAAPWYRGPGVPDRLATLQLSHHGPEGMQVLVFAVVGLNGKLPTSLTSLLGDARVAKVGANLAGDATRVVRDFGCPVRGVFDLSLLNRKPGTKIKKSISLEAVVKENCPKEMHLSKAGADVRTSNWEDWPLTEEQELYASRDAALGLLAFMFKFDMSLTGSPELSKAAIDALVNLVSIDVKSSEPVADMQTGSTKVMKRPAASGTSPGDGDDKKVDHAAFFQHMRSMNVKAPNLGKKDHPKGSKDALANVCIVVSGTLDSFERSEMEEYVKQHGGKTSKSVTAKVTHLVTDHGEAGPSKLAKCKELGIPVVSEDVILNMVGGKATVVEAGGDSSTSKPSKKPARVTKTGDPIAVETSSSVGAKANTKGQGRKSKHSIAADESSTATKGKKAMPTDPVKATVEAAEPVAKAKQAPPKEVVEAELVPDVALAKAIAGKVRAPRGSKKTADESSTATQGKKAKPTDSVKATVAAAAAVAKTEQAPPKEVVEAELVPEVALAKAIAGKVRAPRGSKKALTSERVHTGADDLATKVCSSSGSSKSLPVDCAETASSIATPVRKRNKRSADESAEVKDKDVSELATKKSQTAKGAKKQMPKEMAQPAPAASAQEGSAKTSVGVATPTKKDAEVGPTPPKKVRKKAQASEAGAIEVDGETLSKATGLSMQGELMNLAGRPEMQGKGLSASSLLAALEKTNGLVNPAKRLLLGS